MLKPIAGTSLRRFALKDVQPLASGAHRAVYQHPDDDGLLIKVSPPQAMARLRKIQSVWHKRWRRGGVDPTLNREIEEYTALRARGLQDVPFLQGFYGLVDTDFGVGMVVEKVCGADGRLAPTLNSLIIKGGFTPELRLRIDHLMDEIVRHDIVFSDISGNNILVAAARDGGDRLVVIDGLGDRLWIPLNSISPLFNRIHNRRRYRKMVGKLERVARTGMVKRPRP